LLQSGLQICLSAVIVVTRCGDCTVVLLCRATSAHDFG